MPGLGDSARRPTRSIGFRSSTGAWRWWAPARSSLPARCFRCPRSPRAPVFTRPTWHFGPGNRYGARPLMDEKALQKLLKSVRKGDTSVDAAVAELKDLPFAQLGYATVDTHRSLRFGFPEVVLGEPKT